MTFLSILESALDSSTSEGDRSSESFGVATMIPEPPKFMDYDTIVDESAYKADDGVLKKFSMLTFEIANRK